MDVLIGKGLELAGFVLGTGFVYAPIYVLTSLAIAGGFWMTRRRGERFRAFLFPREVYAHHSTRVDWQMAALNTLFIGLGGLSLAVATPLVADGLVAWAGRNPPDGAIAGLGWGAGLALAGLLFLIDDFCRFLLHFVHHKVPALWPFHEVHHSAQVLSPLTFYRAHPVYFLVQRALITACSGALQAAVAIAAFGLIETWIFYAAAVPSLVYHLGGIHLRHSHVPLRYGRFAERLLVSPYLHQVHHSIDPRHRDKNFGEVLSIWDGLFGTLCVPDRTQPLAFGLTDDAGRAVQPYPHLRAALLEPFRRSARALRRDTPAASARERC